MIDTEPLKALLEKHRSIVAEKDEIRELAARLDQELEGFPVQPADIPLETHVEVLSKSVSLLAKRVNLLDENLDSVQESLLVAVIAIAERLEG